MYIRYISTYLYSVKRTIHYTINNTLDKLQYIIQHTIYLQYTFFRAEEGTNKSIESFSNKPFSIKS